MTCSNVYKNAQYTVRTILDTAGLNIPLAICDVAPDYAKSPDLRAAVEVTMTNTFPFWEGIAIEDAVADLQTDLGWLLAQPETQGKPFVLGETGWPSEGAIDGVGIASPENQARYFAETFCRIDVENNWEYYWFTGIDNEWRLLQDPDNTVEGSWGFLHANLTLKSNFENLAFQCSNGVTYSFAEVDWSIPQVTAAPVALHPASCAAHSQCSGLAGNCCPGDDGVSLLCCSNSSPSTTAPAQSPVLPTSAPVTRPTSAPTARPTVPPTPRPTVLPTPRPTVPPTRSPTPKPTTPAPTSTAPILGAQTSSTSRSDPTVLPTATPTTAAPVQNASSTDTNSTFDPSYNYTFEPTASPSVGRPTPKPSVAVVYRPTASGINDPSAINNSAAAEQRLSLWTYAISLIVPMMVQAMNIMC